ncbi:MAG: hypothetical protein PHC41_02830 [Lachnospiraceae bacterium]|nr:hypothetical protein [Lachnospiraceae bacterium]MDD3615143.1 hypothetical protein [Lachnospiraceae bacterium]
MKKQTMYLIWMYMGGFVAGIVMMNVLYPMRPQGLNLLWFIKKEYLLAIPKPDMLSFIRIWFYRLELFLFAVVLGLTIRNRFFLYTFLCGMGILGGCLYACFLLEFGITGIGICIACLFPHWILYGISLLGLCLISLEHIPGFVRHITLSYLEVYLLLYVLWFAGNLLECYIRPYIMRIF